MNKDKIVIYPIVLTPTKDDSKFKYLVTVPDLDRNTQGTDVINAIEMGKDLIGTMSLVEKLPESNTELPQTKQGEIATLVTVNISEYKRKNDDRLVKKTINIPNYLNELGKSKKINFSEITIAALKQKLGVQ